MKELLIHISKIRVPNKHKRINNEGDEDLRRSIENSGMKDPITVVRSNKGYILADGSRRLRFVRKSNKVIRAIVHENRDEDPEEYATSLRVIANYHRSDFYPSQRAHYLSILSKKFNVPLKEIAKDCGVTERTLYNWMSISDCGAEIRMMIDNGKFPVTASRLLATLKNDGQKHILDRFRDRQKVTYKELYYAVRTVHSKSPLLVRKPFSEMKRKVPKNRANRPRRSTLKGMSLVDVEARIQEKEREITFMNRETIRAKELIMSILKIKKLRALLPSRTLYRFEVFTREEA